MSMGGPQPEHNRPNHSQPDHSGADKGSADPSRAPDPQFHHFEKLLTIPSEEVSNILHKLEVKRIYGNTFDIDKNSAYARRHGPPKMERSRTPGSRSSDRLKSAKDLNRQVNLCMGPLREYLRETSGRYSDQVIDKTLEIASKAVNTAEGARDKPGIPERLLLLGIMRENAFIENERAVEVLEACSRSSIRGLGYDLGSLNLLKLGWDLRPTAGYDPLENLAPITNILLSDELLELKSKSDYPIEVMRSLKFKFASRSTDEFKKERDKRGITIVDHKVGEEIRKTGTFFVRTQHIRTLFLERYNLDPFSL